MPATGVATGRSSGKIRWVERVLRHGRMYSRDVGSVGASSPLDRVAGLLSAEGGQTPQVEATLGRATQRAHTLIVSDTANESTAGAAAIVLLAHAVAALAVEPGWKASSLDRILGGTAELLRLPRDLVVLLVYSAALAEPTLFELPPDLTVETQLRLFLAFSDTKEVSFWRRVDSRAVTCAIHIGDKHPTRRVRAAARAALGLRGASPTGGMHIHAVPVVRWDRPAAAVVFRARPEHLDRVLPLARELAARLGPTLEREALLTRNAARERSLRAANERHAARLGLDIHDGPIQDVLALAAEVQLFRAQLAEVLENHPSATVTLGRIDDIEARLVALDHDLRELARSLESPTVLKVPLEDLVRDEVAAFTRRSGIRTSLDISGNFEQLTASQEIALLRIVQEALQNAEIHSAAEHVQVALTGGRHELQTRITDDGVGFDVEMTLFKAAREGHLGLIGMGERVRLLGGRFDVESDAGGPTTVSATITRWTPPRDGGEGHDR